MAPSKDSSKPSLLLAQVLADLTLLKTIPSTEALSLLAPTSAITLTSATPAPDDKDLARAEEFLSLRAVEVGRGVLEEGRGKVREVEEARRRREESGNEAKKVVRKVSLEPETGWSGKGRMSGAWGM